MKIPKILLLKKTYIILVLVLAGGWWATHRNTSEAARYETVPVEQRTLTQTVEVTGEIRPAERIDLAFKSSGNLQKMNVKVGDVVKPGDLLAELKSDDAQFAIQNASASLAAAQANLSAKLAGETTQSIQVASTQVDQARANFNKATADLESTKSTTQDSVNTALIALQTAQNNLSNQTAIITQNVQNSVDSARLTLLTALGPLTTGLTDGDQIAGVDNTAANQTYLNVLGFLDAGSMPRAKNSYTVAKTAKLDAETSVKLLTASSSKDEIQAAAEKLQNAILLVQAFLGDVQRVLAASLTNASFTESTLAAKKTLIDSDRTAVSAQNTAVLSASQTIRNTELTKTQTASQLQDAYNTAKTAYDTANTNRDVQIRTAETNVTIQKASLDASIATLDLKKSGPRAVDVAPLRAAVAQATVVYTKAVSDLQNIQIIAAVSGTISEVISDVGETITANTPQIRMVGTQTYDIEAQVPEADIVKIAVGQPVEITLDAYGDDVKFAGTVTTKDPAETRVQDAIYYKIRVQVEPAGHEVKPGMTANVSIKTGEAQNTLVIPLRAVRTKEDTQAKTVRVLQGEVAVEKEIELGLKGDEGRVEVKSGLSLNEQVVVAEKAQGTK